GYLLNNALVQFHTFSKRLWAAKHFILSDCCQPGILWEKMPGRVVLFLLLFQENWFCPNRNATRRTAIANDGMSISIEVLIVMPLGADKGACRRAPAGRATGCSVPHHLSR